MTSEEIRTARIAIEDESTNIDSYFEGLENISYLYSYNNSYNTAKRDILTWNDARMAFLYSDRKKLYWDSHQSYSRFILLSHSIVEYLSSRILIDYVDPSRGHSEFLSAIEGLSQRNRQEMMYELDLISGETNDLMNKARGKRNSFAHEVEPHFELAFSEHPLAILDESKEVVEILVELLYNEEYSNIISILNKIFSDEMTTPLSKAPLGELIDLYQFKISQGDIFEQDLPREFRRRGVNPEEAPNFEQFEMIDSLSEMGFASSGSSGIMMVQLESEPYIPNNILLEENLITEYIFEISSDSLVYDMYSLETDEFWWYSFLLVDERVADIHPTSAEGYPQPQKEKVDDSITVSFEYKPTSDGKKDIEIGILVIHEDFEEYSIITEREMMVYGPWT